jgi:hypothetical protein
VEGVVDAVKVFAWPSNARIAFGLEKTGVREPLVTAKLALREPK